MEEFQEQEYDRNFDPSLWKKLLGFIGRRRRTLAGVALAMTLMAACDAFFPLAAKYAIDTFATGGDLTTLPAFIVVYISAIIFEGIMLFIFIDMGGKLETGIVYDIRKAGFEKLQELSFSYYDKTPVGWIMARMTSDAQRIGDVVAWGAVDVFWAIAIIIIVLIVMFVLNVTLALILLVALPFLLVVSLYFQKRILASQREVRKINSRITAAVNEGINGARTTKTLVREAENAREFAVLTSDMRTAGIRAAVLSAVFLPIVLSISSIAVGFVLWRGGSMVMLGGLSFGTLSVFISYTMQIFEPIQQIARIFAELQSASASAERTFSLLDTEPDVKDRPDVLERYRNSADWPSISGDICFDDVTFAYKNRDGGHGEPVLEHFNLHVRAGEKVALVGATGAGKSTIVNIICRFYEPTSGRVLIDGVDYRERPQLWLQSNLGYVLQTPMLFSGTIMENIRYGHLSATDEEVIAAAKRVNAYDIILKMDKGFETDVGEGGDRLSAGEKQLISFARAVLGNPRIFVLDEATSSIDAETEITVQSAAAAALSERTAFIIAHRLSTIRSCDRILVIENGKIVESGSHEMLMEKKGRYYRLYTNQFRQEAQDEVLRQAGTSDNP